VDYHQQRRRENEADLPRRLEFLTPEHTAAVIRLIDRALPVASRHPRKRPCDYAPWEAALRTVEPLGDDWPRFGRIHAVSAEDDLRLFATDVSRPGWPEAHAHLVDFALRFLEADVMLFRMGYVKRHLLIRLRQAHLDAGQSESARLIVRYAVENGTGLEEFREIMRLAARVADEALRAWLEEKAGHVVLTLDDLDPPDIRRAFDSFDEATMRKLTRVGWRWRGTRKWGFTPTASRDLVKTADIPQSNCVRVNAWRILRHINRVSGTERNQPWA
jgi:hypothetical protein